MKFPSLKFILYTLCFLPFNPQHKVRTGISALKVVRCRNDTSLLFTFLKLFLFIFFFCFVPSFRYLASLTAQPYWLWRKEESHLTRSRLVNVAASIFPLIQVTDVSLFHYFSLTALGCQPVTIKGGSGSSVWAHMLDFPLLFGSHAFLKL